MNSQWSYNDKELYKTGVDRPWIYFGCIPCQAWTGIFGQLRKVRTTALGKSQKAGLGLQKMRRSFKNTEKIP